MILKVIQKDPKSVTAAKINNIISFQGFQAPEVAIDEAHKPILVYKTMCDIEIPEGYIGIVSPGQNYPGKSLQIVLPQILQSGLHKDFSILFKFNTDAMPAMFTEKEEVFKLIIVKLDEFNLEVEEYISTNEDDSIKDSTQNENIINEK